ncbi:MAG: hypothetical protein LUH11_02820, partial [Candidatus Gastranaerophilales bacterium]|nr:hypothetical protein [Candidatus Gastranaerophilales bacterium]
MNNTNTKELVIDEKAHSYARIYASLLSNEYQRKRAYASITALYGFINLVEKTPEYKLQKSMTLFRNPLINEQYEVSDLYINGWHLDVRVVTGSDAVLVPKIHYDSNLVPDFYVVIKIDYSVKNAELIGIADTSAVKAEGFDYHYFSIPFHSLISYEEFLKKVKKEKEINLSENSHDLFREYYLGLMDNEIDIQKRNQIIKHLFQCSECRTEFCCFTGFEMVSANAAKYPDILNDQTLGIIGAQNTEDEQYEGKEETIYLADDEQKEDSISDTQNEETISDVLDELFNDEEFVQDDLIEDKPLEQNLPDMISLDKSDEKNIEMLNDDLNDSELPIARENDIQIIHEDNSTINDADVITTTEETGEETGLINDIELVENIAEDNDINLDEEVNENEDNIQKVIIDYDEYGEPVYSYITSVNQDEAGNIDAEIIPINDEETEIINDDSAGLDSTEIEEQIIDDNVLDLNDNQKIYEEDNIEYADNNESSDNKNSEDIAIHPYEIELESDNDNQQPVIIEEQNSPKDKPEYSNNEKYVETNDSEIEDITTEDEAIATEDIETVDNESEENEENEAGMSKSELDEDETAEAEKEAIEADDEEYEEDKEDGEYDDYDIEDVLPEENVKKSSSKTSLIIISLVIILGVAATGGYLFIKNNKSSNMTAENSIEVVPTEQQTNDMFEEQQNEEANSDMGSEENNNDENMQGNEEEQPQEENNEGNENNESTLTENDLIQDNNTTNGDVNKVIANAFSQGSNNITLRGLNWFCTSELFSDKTFKNYLQNLDNTLKQNLKNNILNAVETPPNDTVAAKFAVDNNGNLQKVIISDSSGSEEIDNIVLQSINESFEGEKSQILNDSALKSDMYYLKV